MIIRGQCPCGAVRFVVEGKPRWQGFCHCRSCQRAHAAPVMAGGIVSGEIFSYEGEVVQSKVTDEKTATVRHACAKCGTKVFNIPAPPMRTIFLPLCETKDWFEPQMHMYWSHRVVDVDDDLPKYLDFPAKFGGTGKLAE